MERLAGEFVDAVHIHRPQRMLLIHRQVIRPAVNLARAGKDDADFGIVQATGFKDRKLRPRVDFQVRLRIGHRVHVARLAGEVEEEVLPVHESGQSRPVAHIGDMHPHAARDPGEVEDDDVDRLLVQPPHKFPDRLRPGVEVTGVVQRGPLGPGQRLAHPGVLLRPSHPQCAAAQLSRRQAARIQPGGELGARIDQQAADNADEDDDGAGELLAQDEEEQDQPDDGCRQNPSGFHRVFIRKAVPTARSLL